MTERGKLSWLRCRVALVFSALEMNLNQGGIAWLVLTTDLYSAVKACTTYT